jgi:antitoxin VapB
MSIYIKDPATDKAVRELAKRRGVSLTEAIRGPVEKALADDRKRQNEDFLAEIRELQRELKQYPPTGRQADKAFYDWLSGEED